MGQRTLDFMLITGFKQKITIENTASVLEIKERLHNHYFSHFPIKTMKFIANGKEINNYENIPNDISTIMLAIIPITCNEH